MTEPRLTDAELSAEIARRLFGLVPCDSHPPSKKQFFKAVDGRSRCKPVEWATDHNAAWLVVAEMRQRGWRVSMWDSGGMVAGAFGKGVLHIREVPIGEEPRAICEAALAALDSEEAS